MKLKSGRDVKLVDLTYAQREEADNASHLKIIPGQAGMEVINVAKSRTLWCLYGLGLEDSEKLMQYSDSELNEIMIAVKGAATKGTDPTIKG